MHHHPTGAGGNSFEFLDKDVFFSTIPFEKSGTYLDLGCGFGHYAMAIAEKVSPEGKVYAFDLFDEALDFLTAESRKRNLENIEIKKVNAGQGLPLGDKRVTIALMTTVFHDFHHDGISAPVLNELNRSLIDKGLLAIVEFEKIEEEHGPPKHVRMTPEELRNIIAPFGFRQIKSVSCGPRLYLSLFQKK